LEIESVSLVVTGYDRATHLNVVRNKLKPLVCNTGGKVTSVNYYETVIKFSNRDAAER